MLQYQMADEARRNDLSLAPGSPSSASEPPGIAGPVREPRRPALAPPAGAWDTHAHIFGLAEKFPFAHGRGYTPPPAPVENYLALLDRLGLARGVIVQGNAHGYDNSVVLNALTRHSPRVRGVAITDARVAPATLQKLACARHARPALPRVRRRQPARLCARRGARRVRDLPADDARARLGHAAMVRL